MRSNTADSATGPARVPHRGFTIIEVLIVLGIVGLILLIVFLAVPQLSRTSRDHARKEAVDFVMASLHEYRGLHAEYPMTHLADNRAGFVAGLEAGGLSARYDIRFDDFGTNHEYPFSGPGSPANPAQAHDTISIAPGHRCNRLAGIGPGDTDYPLELTPESGTVHNYRTWASWVYLESKTVYCVDSQN